MQCPICNLPLNITERQGVEIDYCPQCRGVWLDRGELDKILERAAREMPAAGVQRVERVEDARVRDVREQGYANPVPPPRYDRNDHHRHDDDDRHYQHHGHHNPRKRKKGSFLEELFDFD